MRKSIDLALDGDARREHVTPGLKDVGVDLVEVADALNNRPDDVFHGMSLTRELGYRGLVIPKSLAWCGGGIRSRDIVIAPFGAAVFPITVSTRDIFAIGILGSAALPSSCGASSPGRDRATR